MGFQYLAGSKIKYSQDYQILVAFIMSQSSVSVVTATFNSMKYIESTYNCLAAQDFIYWEWVVTDDFSTDGTFELLLQLASEDSRVKPARLLFNQGAAVARNLSISRATGSFLAFLDSDDLWCPNKLTVQIDYMGSDIDFSFTSYRVIEDSGSLTQKFVDLRPNQFFSYEDMLRKAATLGCSTVMLRRVAFTDLTMPLIRTGQDYALWLKLLKSGKVAHLIGIPLTLYRINPNSISRNKLKKAMRQWYIYRRIEDLPFRKAITCFYYYLWRALFRR